ncbi:hypothetical protein [Brucella lupini]|uniref:Uncharacterized protein n=1 Tax=Brucella lupini TaxID=255457 RepID=A0AB34DDP3_9HYPH|nr:hypothetical protein [Brucella lupini]KAB2699928.1 hypothetical protein F9L03_24990 [Brucella lupini]
MKQKDQLVYNRICLAVRVQKSLKEPFTAKDIRQFSPQWPYTRQFSFLAYNCTDNLPLDEALFVRVERGRYQLVVREIAVAADDAGACASG